MRFHLDLMEFHGDSLGLILGFFSRDFVGEMTGTNRGILKQQT